MAKSTSKKKPSATSNTAFSKKTNGHPKPAKDNPSKLTPTKDAEMDVMELDPSDGLIKLFTDCLKDIYWAENHLIKALPKMAKATSLEKLERAILDHLYQTKEHAKRLEQVFELLGKEPQAKKCDAMEGLTKEGEGVIENTDTATPARNLGIIMASQKVEHYEIASYRGLIKLADNLGYAEISDILAETLIEEEDSDAMLADIATNEILHEGDK
ncbi:MAG TPA: ferritin-like domain-containing protein [Chitinophagaceae bacterium]|nr:ferritin-like domain-containing protein [Chitinophagaceae bacterium]